MAYARPPYGRLPFDPIGKWIALGTDNEFGRRVGVTRSVVQSFKIRGLSPYQADRIAVALNIHPILIWGDSFLEVQGDIR